MRNYIFLFIVSSIFLLSGCLDRSADKQTDYEQTKKMVVDILQTEEGKKALADIMQDDKMKEFIIFESDEIKNTITEGLASDGAKDSFKQLFDDPSFVKKFVETMSDEQKKLYKDLMTDATFQKQMLELLQNKEMMEFLITTMRGQEFREHLEETIIETLQSPLFEAKIQEFLAEEGKKKEKKADKEEKDKEQEEGP